MPPDEPSPRPPPIGALLAHARTAVRRGDWQTALRTIRAARDRLDVHAKDLDELQQQAVTGARRERWSWADVADALDVSQQAVWKWMRRRTRPRPPTG